MLRSILLESTGKRDERLIVAQRHKGHLNAVQRKKKAISRTRRQTAHLNVRENESGEKTAKAGKTPQRRKKHRHKSGYLTDAKLGSSP